LLKTFLRNIDSISGFNQNSLILAVGSNCTIEVFVKSALSFFVAPVADKRGSRYSQANIFYKPVTMSITCTAGAALFFAGFWTFTNIFKVAVAAECTMVKVNEIISGGQDTVLFNLF
jgi:hypothetical protein